MLKNTIIGILTLSLFVVTHALVRAENQRYALMLGMCPAGMEIDPLETYRCLEKTKTRTSWLWHVYYAITYN